MCDGFCEMNSNSYQKESKDLLPENKSSSDVLFCVQNNTKVQ